MKIAVCISGEYREFPVAHKFWKFLHWPNVDVYFVSWDKTLHVDKDPSVSPKLLDVSLSDIEQYIIPKRTILLNYLENPFNVNKSYYGGSMIFLWKKCIEVLEESDECYDYIILIRPDMALNYDDNILQYFFQNKINNSDKVIYHINSRSLASPQVIENSENLSDLMIVGSKEAIIKLKHLPLDDFYNLQPPNLVDIHKFLAKELAKFYDYGYNLPIEDWCIVRSNSHLCFDKSFEDCKIDSQEWWETHYQSPGSYSTRKNLTKTEITLWAGLD